MLKDLTGIAREQIEVGEPASLGDIWASYAGRFPQIGAMQTHIRPALNQEFSSFEAAVHAGDEVAFLPPVSGGAGSARSDKADRLYCALTREAIDTRALATEVTRPEHGAVVTFEGVVRNNTKGRATKFLEYECYEAMALKVMDELGRDLLSKHAVGRIAMVHRLGRLEIGEASVAIAVSAPHRKPAFEGAFEAINRLKSTVPIWKKEYFEDGEMWVEGEWGTEADATPRM